jgi:hypothetical protein
MSGSFFGFFFSLFFVCPTNARTAHSADILFVYFSYIGTPLLITNPENNEGDNDPN